MIKSKLKNRNISQEDVFNFSELFKLMKPRVMSLVIFTCAVGLLMAPNIVSTKDTVEHFDALYNKCEIRYGDLKKQLAEDIIAYTSPIRDRIIEILEDDTYLAKVARMGAEKARESAAKTLKEVKDVIGFRKLF